MQRFVSHAVRRDALPLSRAASLAMHELEYTMQELMGSTQAPAHLPTTVSYERRLIGRPIISPKGLNALFKQRLVARGWQSQYLLHNRMACDFYKDGVLVEVQLGHHAYCAENVGLKFPLALRQSPPGAVQCCVLIVPSQRLSSRMSSSVACFENFMNNYVTPLQDTIAYPLVIFSLDHYDDAAG